MIKNDLLKLDFTSNQAEVYLALLETGETGVGPLIKMTGFHRSIVYRALEELVARQLVFKTQKKGAIQFAPTDPKRLVVEFQNKQDLASEVANELKSKAKLPEQQVQVSTGRDGITSHLDMILEVGEPVFIIGANYELQNKYAAYYPDYEAKLSKKKIARQMLVQHHLKDSKPPVQNALVRFLPSSFPESPLVIVIFGNCVAHVLWESPETVFTIENKSVAEAYRRYFKILWEQAK